MNLIDWNWGDLITGLVGLILGWLTGIFGPGKKTPGPYNKP